MRKMYGKVRDMIDQFLQNLFRLFSSWLFILILFFSCFWRVYFSIIFYTKLYRVFSTFNPVLADISIKSIPNCLAFYHPYLNETYLSIDSHLLPTNIKIHSLWRYLSISSSHRSMFSNDFLETTSYMIMMALASL